MSEGSTKGMVDIDFTPTWIFPSQVFGWYLKLPNCLMSKSSNFSPSWLRDWLRSKSDRAWWRSFDVTPLRLGRDKNHGNFGHEKPWPPQMHAGILGTAQTALEISTPFSHFNLDDWWKRFKDIQRLPIFWNPWWILTIVFQESWRYCAGQSAQLIGI